MKPETIKEPIVYLPSPFKDQSCDTCLFFLPDCDHVDFEPTCKRYSQTVHKISQDWCGEYKNKGKSDDFLQSKKD